mmetsp:Transcript_1787/g.7062  ORF Transcript_1787/g.7062 Transcript_1787/m.7062 type:complete len:221 (-) Transcript_1787:86-748(-)
MDGVRVGLRGSQGRLRLREVLHGVVRAGLQHVDVDQQQLVVQLLDLEQEPVQHLEGGEILLVLLVEAREAALHALPQEGALLLVAPLDAVLAHVDLQVQRVGRLRQQVDQVLHDFRRLRLGQVREHRPQLLGEIAQVVAALLLHEELAQAVDGLFAALCVGVVDVLVEDDVLVGLGRLVGCLGLKVLGLLQPVVKGLRRGQRLLVDLHRIADQIDVHGSP